MEKYVLLKNYHISNIKKLLSNNEVDKFVIKPKNKNNSIEIQKFLLKNGFKWNADEKWIDVDKIGVYILYSGGQYINYKYTIMYNMDDIYSILLDFNKVMQQSNNDKFIDDLFKDII